MAILGIDEVGRGPWAGPLVVGAVVLTEGFDCPKLTDSKKLTQKQRRDIFAVILGDTRRACRYRPPRSVEGRFPQTHLGLPENIGLGWVSSVELDEVGLSQALCLATRRAVEQVSAPFHEIVIDGTVNFLRGTKLEKYVSVLPKADALVPAVSAASIVAKVARDEYMVECAGKYPGYGFEKHVGYGTAAHKNALEELGLTPEHRRSFRPIAEMCGVVNITTSVDKNTTEVGKVAEGLVADYLQGQGHVVLERNWKTKYCEIDIVSQKAEKIYFTEVKYRRGVEHGSGLDAIDADKQRRMRRAAEAYCALKKCDLQPVALCAAVHGVPPTIESVVALC